MKIEIQLSLKVNIQQSTLIELFLLFLLIVQAYLGL